MHRAVRSPTVVAVLGLLLVTATWGSTFPLLKGVVERVPPADFLAVRFALAAEALAAVRPRVLAPLSPAVWRRGAALGLVYGLAQILQTVGLQTTSASVSGFVTGMYVVLTPVLATALLRQRLSAGMWLAVALATTGLAVLSLRGFAVGYGEAVTLAGAALYALHIIGLGRWSATEHAWGLTVVQMAVVAVVCALAAAPGGLTLPQHGGEWAVLAHMALVAGALALLVQTWAQAHLAPTRAAIIMTTEPVWAGFFAVVLGGEVLGVRVLVGGALVLAAMHLSELAPGRTTLAQPLPVEDAAVPVEDVRSTRSTAAGAASGGP